jgi:hypothetical protein
MGVMGEAASRGAGDDEGAEGAAAERAGRGGLGPGLRPDDLDDAAAAEAVVAAGEQLDVGRVLLAHHAEAVVVGMVRWGERGGGCRPRCRRG